MSSAIHHRMLACPDPHFWEIQTHWPSNICNKYMGDMVVEYFQRKFDKNDPFGNYKVLSYKDGGRFEFVHYPFFVLQYDERREVYKPYYFEYIEEEDKITKKSTRKIGPLTEEEFTTKYNHCKRW
ncbi:hypothetical protein OSTOST_24054 [Ostertagia ostertagi]